MNLDKLLEMDYNKFINTLKEIEYSKRLDLLNNEKFKNKLFLVDKKDNVSKFSLVFQIYSAKDLLSKMDLNLIFLIKLQQNIIVNEHISIYPLLNNPLIISNKFGTFSII